MSPRRGELPDGLLVVLTVREDFAVLRHDGLLVRPLFAILGELLGDNAATTRGVRRPECSARGRSPQRDYGGFR